MRDKSKECRAKEPGQVGAVQQALPGSQLHGTTQLAPAALCNLRAEGSPWRDPRPDMGRAHEAVQNDGRRSAEAADHLIQSGKESSLV